MTSSGNDELDPAIERASGQVATDVAVESQWLIDFENAVLDDEPLQIFPRAVVSKPDKLYEAVYDVMLGTFEQLADSSDDQHTRRIAGQLLGVIREQSTAVTVGDKTFINFRSSCLVANKLIPDINKRGDGLLKDQEGERQPFALLNDKELSSIPDAFAILLYAIDPALFEEGNVDAVRLQLFSRLRVVEGFVRWGQLATDKQAEVVGSYILEKLGKGISIAEPANTIETEED